MGRGTDQPESSVGSSLIVPTSSGMQFPPDIFPDNLTQTSLIGGKDILVIILDIELLSVWFSFVTYHALIPFLLY
jgi:hypothetical protein